MTAQSQTGGEVLLIATEWRARALLLAELREAGYEVVALPGMRAAFPPLVAGQVRPALAVLDLVGDPEARPRRVRQMLRFLEGVPVVLLVGAYGVPSFTPLREEVDAWLTRPLRVGSVVAAVQRLYPPTR
ncbi:MAG TPA: hypothetical protein ENI39_01825 [Anaerolineae bacterium]|nr:hypothetical protein [Anaerolineae bacterium]